VWTGLNWLRVGYSGGHYGQSSEFSGAIIYGEFISQLSNYQMLN